MAAVDLVSWCLWRGNNTLKHGQRTPLTMDPGSRGMGVSTSTYNRKATNKHSNVETSSSSSSVDLTECVTDLDNTDLDHIYAIDRSMRAYERVFYSNSSDIDSFRRAVVGELEVV